ncbi:MAG: hypothetical protein KJ943_15885 [Alphaproteobacteria bacterium]|nr:hypothetical protein [Alphaproteobacteria bacterium]
MSNNTTGPQSWQEAVNKANESKQLPAGGHTNTNGWHWQAKEKFYGNGGR